MDLQSIHFAFESWRRRHARPAWKPVIADSENSNSWFGGSPSLSTATRWPACRQCERPMQFFLQLDLAELPDGFAAPAKSGLLELFYCSTDDGACETWQPFSGTHAILIVDSSVKETLHPRGIEPIPKVSISGWNEIVDTPHPEEHEALGITYNYDFAKNVASVSCSDPVISFQNLDIDLEVAENVSNAVIGDKLGGWPHWIQGAEYPSCPMCGQRMEIFLQLDSEDNLSYMFGDAGCAHLTQCREHPGIFAFGWACS